MILKVHTFKFKPMLTAIIIDGKPWFIVNDIADYIGISSTYINANVPQVHLFQLRGREHIAKIKKIDSCVYRLNLIDKDGIFYLGNHFNKKIISHLTNPLVEFITRTIEPQATEITEKELAKRRQKKRHEQDKTEQPDLFQEQRFIELENQVSSLVWIIKEMGERLDLQEQKINFLLDELGVIYNDNKAEQINSLVKVLGLSVDQAKELVRMGEKIKTTGMGFNGPVR